MTHAPSAPSPDTGLARKAIDALLVSGSLAIWVIVYLLVAAISFLIYSGPDDIAFMLVINVLLATVIAGARFLLRNRRSPFMGMPGPATSTVLSAKGFTGLAIALATMASMFAISFVAWAQTLSDNGLPSYTTTMPIYLAAAVLVGPLTEELLFRGVIQQSIRTTFSAPTAIIASSLIFSAYHMNPLQMIATLPLGLTAGIIAERTRTVRWAVVYHVIHNLAATLSPLWLREILGTMTVAMLSAAGFLAVLITAFVIMARHPSPRPGTL